MDPATQVLNENLAEGIRQHAESREFLRTEGESIAQAKADMVESATAKETELDERVTYFFDNAEEILKSMHSYEIDLQASDFDAALYYPVMFSLKSYDLNRIELFKMYAAFNGEANINGLMGLAFKADVGGGTWSGNPMFTNISVNHQTYQQAIAAVGLMYHGYSFGLFLKGGHKYTAKTNRFNQPPLIIKEQSLNYTNKPDGSPQTINCGPVDLATAQASDGGIPMHHASPQSMPSIYIQTLGG